LGQIVRAGGVSNVGKQLQAGSVRGMRVGAGWVMR
jgi:hypothetical protein